MQRNLLMETIQNRLGPVVLSLEPMKNEDLMVLIDRKDLVSAAGVLKNDPSLCFSTLMNHLGIDYGDRLAVVYNLYSPLLRQKITLKAFLGPDDLEVPSLERAFPGINWYERETFDLFGIRFIGHSNLKRLLLPDDWIGHPLRKDYAYPDSYNGMETGRADLLDDPDLTGIIHV